MVEVSREEQEAHQACLERSRVAVADVRAKRLADRAKADAKVQKIKELEQMLEEIRADARAELTQDQVNEQAAEAAREILRGVSEEVQ